MLTVMPSPNFTIKHEAATPASRITIIRSYNQVNSVVVIVTVCCRSSMHDPSARRQHNERQSNNLLIASVSNINVHRAFYYIKGPNKQ